MEWKLIEHESLQSRDNKSLGLNIIISIFLFAIVSRISEWKYGLIISIVFFIIQTLKSKRWNKTFVTHISLENNVVNLEYKLSDELLGICDNLSNFSFLKEIAINRTKTAYLAIYYKEKLLLKQFELGEWTEAKFDEVVFSFKAEIR